MNNSAVKVRPIVSVPNLITLAGILCVPIYIYGYLSNNLPLAIGALATIVLSDLFDGFLARQLGQATKLGKSMDKFRDHLLVAAILINLLWIGAHLTAIAVGFTELCLWILDNHLAAKLAHGLWIALIFFFL